MKKMLFALLFTALTILAPSWAQSGLTDGLVTKVDTSANKITIKHGPVKKFDMDEGMTMVYAVKDPTLLKAVKPGDKVKFDADHVNGQFIVTKIEKARWPLLRSGVLLKSRRQRA